MTKWKPQAYKVWEIVNNKMVLSYENNRYKVKCKDCWVLTNPNATALKESKCRCTLRKDGIAKKQSSHKIVTSKPQVNILESLCTIQSHMIKNNISDCKVSELIDYINN